MKLKKSNTLVILGTNASINNIKPAVWEKISEYDTLAVNYWLYHEYVPTYFVFEYSRDYRVALHQQALFRKRA